jgi:hypothetical protein
MSVEEFLPKWKEASCTVYMYRCPEPVFASWETCIASKRSIGQDGECIDECRTRAAIEAMESAEVCGETPEQAAVPYCGE